MFKTAQWLPILMMLSLGSCKKDENAKKSAAQVETEKPAKKDEAKTPPPAIEKPAPKAAPAKDKLSKAWAIYLNRVPGAGRENTESPSAERTKADTLRAEGYALYKKKDDAKAVVKYEEALEHWANGELYYNYANSLSNIPRLEDSIKAYDIAMQLGYEKPELALYNTACSYSRLENVEPAYDYLAKAVHRGYNAFKFIEKDPDMKFLRSQPDWKERIEKLVPPQVRINPEKLVGSLEVMTPRDPETYTLCANGKVHYVSSAANDGSCCGATHLGTWSIDTGDLVVNWTESCSSQGSGKVLETYEACDQHDSCGEAVCAPNSERGSYILVQREELAAMENQRELEDDGQARVLPFDGPEPDFCK